MKSFSWSKQTSLQILADARIQNSDFKLRILNRFDFKLKILTLNSEFHVKTVF